MSPLLSDGLRCRLEIPGAWVSTCSPASPTIQECAFAPTDDHYGRSPATSSPEGCITQSTPAGSGSPLCLHTWRTFEKARATNEEIKAIVLDIRAQIDQLRGSPQSHEYWSASECASPPKCADEPKMTRTT